MYVCIVSYRILYIYTSDGVGNRNLYIFIDLHHIYICIYRSTKVKPCICVYIYDRQRESARQRDRAREIEIERERECNTYICVHACVRLAYYSWERVRGQSYAAAEERG